MFGKRRSPFQVPFLCLTSLLQLKQLAEAERDDEKDEKPKQVEGAAVVGSATKTLMRDAPTHKENNDLTVSSDIRQQPRTETSSRQRFVKYLLLAA